MKPTPSTAPFAALLAEAAVELQRGTSCLITADKAWTQPLYRDLRERLRSLGRRCEYIDGRPPQGDSQPEDVGVMLTAITHLRRVVRRSVVEVVIVLPHLDVMTAAAGGWTNISREVVPLLYEVPEVVVLGFRDPTLPLLPVVSKLFLKHFDVERPFCLDDTSPACPVAPD